MKRPMLIVAFKVCNCFQTSVRRIKGCDLMKLKERIYILST